MLVEKLTLFARLLEGTPAGERCQRPMLSNFVADNWKLFPTPKHRAITVMAWKPAEKDGTDVRPGSRNHNGLLSGTLLVGTPLQDSAIARNSDYDCWTSLTSA